MTLLQAVVTIVVAIISGLGGSFFSYRQFILKRKDEKEEKSIQKQIDDSIKTARVEISEEIREAMQQGIVDCGVIGDRAIREVQDEFIKKLEEGLKARGEEGKERFEINSKQIVQNTEQIKELTGLVKDQITKIDMFAESMTSLNSVVRATAESQRTSNYDRLLIVCNKILKSGKMTITDKTNLKQLYKSWSDLKGEDPKIDTMYEECIKMTPIPDEN